MARTSIVNAAIEEGSDNGNVLWSLVTGEQLEYEVQLNFLSDLTGYTFEAVVVEGLNVLGDASVPTQIRPSGVSTTLATRTSGISVFVRFPSTLGSTWTVKATPDVPVHGFFELRVTEPAGAFPKTWKPLRGVVQLQFSPTDIV